MNGEETPQPNPNEATEKIVFGRTKSLTEEDLRGMDEDPSTPRCTRMAAAITARTANLDAAARQLKEGPPENQYGI